MIKKSRILLIITIILLALSLGACGFLGSIIDVEDDTVTSVVFSSQEYGSINTLTIFSDFNFELSIISEEGITKTDSLFKGTYTNEEGGYALTMVSGENKLSSFGVVYEEGSTTTEQIAELNGLVLTAKVLSDSACSFLGHVMFVNGDTGSKDSIITVTSQNKFMGFGLSDDYDPDCDFYCELNGSISNQSLLVIYGDGYLQPIQVNEDMISGFDSSVLGKQEVTIAYEEGKTYAATVCVRNATASGFSTNIENYVLLNTSLEDFKSDEHNYIRVNGNIKYLTEAGITITGFDTSVSGRITIDISYGGDTEKEEITIYDADNLLISEFYVYGDLGVRQGDDLVFHANVTRNDGTSVNLENDAVIVSGFNSNTVGPQLVTFTYSGVTFNKVFYVYDDNTKNIVQSINVEKRSSTPNYVTLVNGVLDFTNHYLKLTHIDGTTAEVELTEGNLSGYDLNRLIKSGTLHIRAFYTRDGYTYYNYITIVTE